MYCLVPFFLGSVPTVVVMVLGSLPTAALVVLPTIVAAWFLGMYVASWKCTYCCRCGKATLLNRLNLVFDPNIFGVTLPGLKCNNPKQFNTLNIMS